MRSWSLLPVAAIVLAACADRIDAPTAVITLPDAESFLPGEPLVLDGTASTDPNTELELDLTYAWRLIAAPPGSVAEFNSEELPVVAIVPDLYGDYVFGLSVHNGVLWSDEATATATVEGCGNEPPEITGLAAAPAAPATDQVVQLSATWTDPDVDTCGLEQEIDWYWALTALPPGSSAMLNDPAAINPSFTADRPGDYGVALTLVDSTGRPSGTERMTVTVSACGDAPPTVDAVAVTPASPDIEQAVTLDVTVSDADNDAGGCGYDQTLDVASAFTSRPAGSAAALSPSEGISPAFVPDVPGTYVVRTTVSDGTGRQGWLDTSIAVGACGTAAPEIDSVGVTPASPAVGSLVSFDVTASDLDNDAGGCDLGQVLDLQTWFVARPSGSSATLAPSEGAEPAFVADVSGPYVLRTQVTDDTGRTGYTDTTVDVSTCGEADPEVATAVANPADPATGEATVVTLTVTDADNTACSLGQTLTVTSEIVSAPGGSQATLSPSAGLTVGFTPDMPGPYVIRVTVDDGTGRQGTRELTVTADVCGSRPPDALASVITPTFQGPGDDVFAVVESDVAVGLSAAASSDPDVDDGCAPDTLGYTWRFTSMPAGSFVELNDPGLVDPSFFPDLPGTYVLELAVTDGTFEDRAQLTIEVDPSLLIVTATDFDIEFVTGGSGLWNEPRGLAVDANGNIYVAQHGGDRVTVTSPTGVVTSSFSAGGFINNPEDVVFEPTSGDLFVSNTFGDRVLTLSPAGQQSVYADTNFIDEPTGLAIEGDNLLVADWNDDIVYRLDANDRDGNPAVRDTENFNDNLNQPWGVALSGGNYYAVNQGGNEALYRWDGSTDQLANLFDEPADIVMTPSGDIAVADWATGAIYLVQDCGGGDCEVSLLAWGPWSPWGLAFESDTSLLVTDGADDALFRITGSF